MSLKLEDVQVWSFDEKLDTPTARPATVGDLVEALKEQGAYEARPQLMSRTGMLGIEVTAPGRYLILRLEEL